MKKRLISMLLVLAMVFSFVSTAVFAEGEEQVDAAAETKVEAPVETKVEAPVETKVEAPVENGNRTQDDYQQVEEKFDKAEKQAAEAGTVAALEGEGVIAGEEVLAQIAEELAEKTVEAGEKTDELGQKILSEIADDAKEAMEDAQEARNEAVDDAKTAIKDEHIATEEAQIAEEAKNTAEGTGSASVAKKAAETAENAAEVAEEAATEAAAVAADAVVNAVEARENAVEAFQDYKQAEAVYEETQRVVDAQLKAGELSAEAAEKIAADAAAKAEAQRKKADEALSAAEDAVAKKEQAVQDAKKDLKEQLDILDGVIATNALNVAEKGAVAAVADAALLATKAAVAAADITVGLYEAGADVLEDQIGVLDTEIGNTKESIAKLEKELENSDDSEKYLIAKDALEAAKAALAKAEAIKEKAATVKIAVLAAKKVDDISALAGKSMTDFQVKLPTGDFTENDIVSLTKKVLDVTTVVGVGLYGVGDPSYLNVQLVSSVDHDNYYFSAQKINGLSSETVYFKAVVDKEKGVVKYYPAEMKYEPVSDMTEAEKFNKEVGKTTSAVDTDLLAEDKNGSTYSIVTKKDNKNDSKATLRVKIGSKYYKLNEDVFGVFFEYRSNKVYVTLIDKTYSSERADKGLTPIYDSNSVSEIWGAVETQDAPDAYIAEKQEALNEAEENYKQVDDNLRKLFEKEEYLEETQASLEEELEKLDAKLNGSLGARVITALIKENGTDFVEMIASGKLDQNALTKMLSDGGDAIKGVLEEGVDVEKLNTAGVIFEAIKDALGTTGSIAKAVGGLTDGEIKLTDVQALVELVSGDIIPLKMKQAIAHVLNDLAQEKYNEAKAELDAAIEKAKTEIAEQNKNVFASGANLAVQQLLLLDAYAAQETAKFELAEAERLEKEANEAADAAKAAREALEELQNQPVDDSHVQEAKEAFEAAKKAADEAEKAARIAMVEAFRARREADKAAQYAEEARAAYEALLKTSSNELGGINWATLKAVNPDIVGWIVIPGTNVDCAVVQGKDNEFYTNHSFEDKEDDAGCIFLDTACASDFSGNSILYGNNGENGKFKVLPDYLDPDFLNGHNKAMICTPTGNFSFELDKAETLDAGDDSFKAQSESGNTLTLTTFADETNAQRIVVTGSAK